MFRQITIIGPGLLGASLAMAVRQNSSATKIVVWARSHQSREKCRNLNWCDDIFESPEKAVVDSDFVLLCTPVNVISSLLKTIKPALKTNTLVSDVGSTKRLICEKAQNLFKDTSAVFIGSHPMAGSEQAGMENARADLFKGAACMLTPMAGTAAEMTQLLNRFWESLGMRVSVFTPQTHDAIVAHVSHLPHVLASTLCKYLAEKDSNWQTLGGGGLRDTTRIAAGDPELWKQILEQNRNEILQAITGFERKLDELKIALTENKTEQILEFLEQGKIYRDQFQQV